MQKLVKIAIAIGFVSTLAGCANKSNTPEPKPLPKLQTVESVIKVDWQTTIGSGIDGQKDVSLAPTLEGNDVLTTSMDGKVTATRQSNGQTLWQKQLSSPISTTPASDQSIVVIGSLKGDIIALDRQDGHILWQHHIPSSIFAKPLISGNQVFIHLHNGTVVAYDSETGQQQWQHQIPRPDRTLIGDSQPILTQGLLLVGSASGELWAFQPNSGKVAWHAPIAIASANTPDGMVDINATPLVMDQTIYVAAYQDGINAFSTKDGKIQWRQPTSIFNNLSTDDDQQLFATTADGTVVSYQLDDGTVLWKQKDFQWRNLSAPAYLNNVVVIGDLNGNVLVLDAKNGEYIDHLSVASSPIRGQPQTDEDHSRIFVQTNNGKLIALTIQKPS